MGPTAHRLRRIFHDEDVVFVTQPRDPGHVRGHPEEVSRNDTQGLPRDRLLEAAIIEVEGRGVDVAYPDIQAGPDHRGRYGKARIGGNHDLPAAREALQGPENQGQPGLPR